MDLTMSCSSLSLLFFLISLQIHFLAPAASAFPLFQECAPSNCGGQEVSYPFRLDKQPTYCGHPGYELDCDGDSLTLSIESLEYRVIHMNTSTQILVVVRMNLSEDICLETYNETTLDLNLFNYTSNDLNSTLFYNCDSRPNLTLPTSPPYRFSCPNSKDGYFVPGDNLPKPLLSTCSSIVHVPISKSEPLGFPPPSMDGNNNPTISEILNERFEITWILNTSQCESCNKSGGRCGYGWAGQEFCCFCPEGVNSTTCGRPGKQRVGVKIGIGMAASGVGIGITLIIMLSFRKKRVIRIIMALIKHRSEQFDGEMKIEGLVSSRRYTYKDIKRMTNSFKEKLGEGGYGCVYKGKLRDDQFVAVKLLKKLKGNAEEFFNEVASISRTSHINVVNLLGFCFEGRKRALVYEFMPNGSLEKFIFNRSNTLEVDQQLSWDTMYQISLGIAHGLEYLHRGCNTRILHFDIKPHNILLDANYHPKISDFGLAKICPREESIVSLLGARGTVGYIAPELIIRNIGGVSHKSDVYSYGMMVLEMISKRKNIEVTVAHTSEIYFPYWVH
ncbi:LEAF RUST 10 DISEASE-RESISTANCE LOCUS RECEPTOR-LIKE PROTEIN KINASE-like 2.1 [Eucalyptus grandis]|uniref:LEAF RUST 10 DISEASE-RESISTANCE LOCUS RECEPTOR-LIKE PROTEIN KINASE-like 2.1 n=1 Tax=Eucalyptus grandis TaxID=71139 RepID=UPI00192EF9A5|nr:LEAF RUST 10 DISEASE-RESISTANCE LOCUS RECEPTOR-LIKE PROTEIN KINASE-like 2.1 [Eucalyptus grandis]